MADGIIQDLKLFFKNAVRRTGFRTEGGILARIEVSLVPSVNVIRSEFTASEWTVLVALSAVIGFIVLLLPMYATTNSPELTLIISLLGGIFVAYAVLTIPTLLAFMKVEGMEKAMPLFLSNLTAVYSERKNMRDALLSVMSIDYGKLSPELREGVSNFEVSGNPKTSFRRLRETINSRKINRAFDLITKSIESGVYVSESLSMLTNNITSDFDAETERSSRIGLPTWMILLSSSLFYPLFAGMGYNITLILEGLMGATIYSGLEKQLLLFSLIVYMLLANALDAMFIGQVRYGSVKRGLMMVFPVMLLIASIVFVLSMKLSSIFVG
ncbi:MAG: hypothetical protein Sv326_0779 [Candidatus Fermentimicrarchaeum limneticum]|uniref:Type II secretion system protein GspF domain-containing protein n=1 Tax=Fermentimicrarchaeum limneticum TaxID=2795018 RepID=A0A7D5XI95_FERL1|nr:MAG: hypothetical protein Sv326_0779 [Candidatus Fermentimicrarchaeum limneticum]